MPDDRSIVGVVKELQEKRRHTTRQQWETNLEGAGLYAFEKHDLDFMVPWFNSFPAIATRLLELSEKLEIAMEALDFVVNRENLMFAECCDAEEILQHCRQALFRIRPTPHP